MLSVIIPFYNLSSYIERTLGGVIEAAKRFDETLECICVDDGSSDDTGKKLDEFKVRFEAEAPRVKYEVIHQANGGEGAARNTGISAATGEWMIFLDGDDVWLENALSEAEKALKESSTADIISLKYTPFEDGSPLPNAKASSKIYLVATDKNIPAELICKLGVFPTLFRRRKYGEMRFSSLPLGADRLFVMECLAKADEVVVSDAVVEGYRIRSGSMARAKWDCRKIMSLNDHARLGIVALATSGKDVASEGIGYLAALVVSEVPARIARLSTRDEAAQGLWKHWLDSVAELPVKHLPMRIRVMRRLILSSGFSRALSIVVARLCRTLGVA